MNPGRDGRGGPGQVCQSNVNFHFMNGLIAASQTSLGRIGDAFDAESFERMVALLAEADLIY